MQIKPLFLLPPLIFLGLALTFLGGMERDNPQSLPSTFVGRDAPPLPVGKLPDIPQLTDDMLRQPGVKLVNYWASWCPPCRAEHPTLTELSKRLPVYGVNLKDRETAATAFLTQYGNPFAAIATDSRGRGAIDWGVTAPPETFIIDGSGRVLYRYAGPLIRDDYAKRFLPELEKALAGASEKN